jgi:hypothetical protein
MYIFQATRLSKCDSVKLMVAAEDPSKERLATIVRIARPNGLELTERPNRFLRPSYRGRPSVDGDILPRDVTRRRASQKYGDAFQVFVTAQALERRALHDLVADIVE